MEPEAIKDGITAALATAGGGGLLYGAVKFFTARLITQIDKIGEKLAKLEIQTAVMSSQITELQKMGVLIGRLEASASTGADDLVDLRVDIFMAHERIRYLASGQTDFSQIQTPPKIRRK